MASSLIQIVYNEEQKAACYPFSTIYFNDALTIFFENAIISSLVTATQAEKIGVCSWKLREKFRMNVCRPRELTEEIINSDYDVLSFTCNTKYHKMLTAANHWHKGFRAAIEKVCESIGQRCPGEVKNPIYQNAFTARTEIYQDYVKNWLNPAMEAMINDPELKEMVTVDSGYTNLAKKDAADQERLMRLIGMPFYPLCPFVLERLFSIYIQTRKINVTWL